MAWRKDNERFSIDFNRVPIDETWVEPNDGALRPDETDGLPLEDCAAIANLGLTLAEVVEPHFPDLAYFLYQTTAAELKTLGYGLIERERMKINLETGTIPSGFSSLQDMDNLVGADVRSYRSRQV